MLYIEANNYVHYTQDNVQVEDQVSHKIEAKKIEF